MYLDEINSRLDLMFEVLQSMSSQLAKKMDRDEAVERFERIESMIPIVGSHSKQLRNHGSRLVKLEKK